MLDLPKEERGGLCGHGEPDDALGRLLKVGTLRGAWVESDVGGGAMLCGPGVACRDKPLDCSSQLSRSSSHKNMILKRSSSKAFVVKTTTMILKQIIWI